VKDETLKVSFHVEFPTTGGSAQEVFQLTAVDDWSKSRNSLREYMAIIPGNTVQKQIAFLKSVFETASEVPDRNKETRFHRYGQRVRSWSANAWRCSRSILLTRKDR
jgi:hypothetical protein